MADEFVKFLRGALPREVSRSLSKHLDALDCSDYKSILQDPLVKELLDVKIDHTHSAQGEQWCDQLFQNLGKLLSERKIHEASGSSPKDDPSFRQHFFLLVAVAALQCFVQSNVTGPVLPFSAAEILLPPGVAQSKTLLNSFRKSLIHSLSSEGIAARTLAANPELLCLADTILTSPPIQKNAVAAHWAKLRVHFTHQKLLSEPSSRLQTLIYESFHNQSAALESLKAIKGYDEISSLLRLEKTAVDIFHGQDKDARQEIAQLVGTRKFEFAITGRLGKRTKYQQKDISQLVVLAKSGQGNVGSKSDDMASDGQYVGSVGQAQPENLDLNDDTLLEKLSFTARPHADLTAIVDEESLPASLAAMDPGDQPILDPLDSTTLLSLASAITNTSPANGLTREETLPYAVRVLEGGSSNWQVYTQALLVRSRIEGYNSRTTERGLLQLQALVDSIIADTTGSTPDTSGEAASFLPRADQKDAAPAGERLHYVYALNSPNRWDLEAELASRWVTVGGLRSALEIYERLEMWPEAALCWAAVDREDKGRQIIRQRLFHATNGRDEDVDIDEEKWQGSPRDPPPDDAARLYCILGDFDTDPSMYEKAWEVSGNRYARAQRSLGRQYFTARNFDKASEAYAKAIHVNQLNQSSWFAYGCTLLELAQFSKAAEAFSRCVQLEDTDAEAWSNLAAALLRVEDESPQNTLAADDTADDVSADGFEPTKPKADPQKHKRDALKALKRAATLKHDSYRIWDNVLTVSATLSPPAFSDLLIAQKRIIELRGQTDGEKCVDVNILEALVRYIMKSSEGADVEYDASKPGLPRLVVELVEKDITPLITGSTRLWRVISSLALWRKRPASALEAQEKAWRAATTHNPGWESGAEQQWNDVVDATIDLADAYENLGPMEKTEGLAAGSGQLVAKDWKFKAKSAVRGIMNKGKATWEDSEGWNRLNVCLEGINNAA